MQWKGCADCNGWELLFQLVMMKAKVNKWTVLFGCRKGSGRSQSSDHRDISRKWNEMVKTGGWFANVRWRPRNYIVNLVKSAFIITIIYFKSGSKAHKKQWTEDRQEYTEYAVYIQRKQLKHIHVIRCCYINRRLFHLCVFYLQLALCLIT